MAPLRSTIGDEDNIQKILAAASKVFESTGRGILEARGEIEMLGTQLSDRVEFRSLHLLCDTKCVCVLEMSNLSVSGLLKQLFSFSYTLPAPSALCNNRSDRHAFPAYSQ